MTSRNHQAWSLRDDHRKEKHAPNRSLIIVTSREELTAIDDYLVLKGDRIVIPNTLRPEVLKIIHQAHLGQEKCLLRASTCVLWPGIAKEIIHQVYQCAPC